jgi:hypothetical protein
MSPLHAAPRRCAFLVCAILPFGFATATPQASSGAVRPPDSVPTWNGTAAGEMSVGADKVPLRHAYVLVLRPRKATADETRIVLSDEPIPLEVLDDAGRKPPRFQLEQEFRGVEVVLDAAGAPRSAFFHHERLPAGLEVQEVTKLLSSPSGAGRLAGRLTFSDPGFSFGFDATFDAPLSRPKEKERAAPDPTLTTEQRARAELEDQGLELKTGGFSRAVREGDAAAVKLYLDAGMPATTGEPDRGVLADAVEAGNAEIAKVLLAAGASPNGHDYGQTPLLIVASGGAEVGVVRALVEAGANVNVKGDGNLTPLIAAAGSGKVETVDYLLGAGAKVTARTTYGWSALHSAVQKGDFAMVRRLIAAGADVARDRKDLIEYARTAKSPEIEKAIREAPAAPPEAKGNGASGRPAGEEPEEARARRTIGDVKALATAVESYAIDNNRYPSATSAAELPAFLSPAYIPVTPVADAWNTPYVYAVSTDGMHFRIVSAGSDRSFEEGTRTTPTSEAMPPVRVVDGFAADIVYQDGRFLQVPRLP